MTEWMLSIVDWKSFLIASWVSLNIPWDDQRTSLSAYLLTAASTLEL